MARLSRQISKERIRERVATALDSYFTYDPDDYSQQSMIDDITSEVYDLLSEMDNEDWDEYPSVSEEDSS